MPYYSFYNCSKQALLKEQAGNYPVFDSHEHFYKKNGRTKVGLGIRELINLFQGRLPGQLVIQYTDHCNATCPQCGMRASSRFKRNRLSKDDIRRIIDAAAERGVRAISFTGGEPLLFLNELAEYMKYAGAAGMDYIRTGTNGFLFARPDDPGFLDRVKKTVDILADTPVRNFWISIDSAVPAIHENMRGFTGVIKGLEKALPIFHQNGIWPSANIGLNRNLGGDDLTALSERRDPDKFKAEDFYNDVREGLARFYRYVIDMGFTMVNACYPMSVENEPDGSELSAVYSATSTDNVVRFSPEEKRTLFLAFLDTIPKFRSKVRIFSPRSSLYTLCKQYDGEPDQAFSCRGGQDFFFIDSRDGNTYPCGYRGHENLGKFWDLDWAAVDRENQCRLCDWECFRDPSELFGPVTTGLSNPVDFIRKFRRDPEYFKIWLEDLKYYRACGFFNGRQAPNHRRLIKFAFTA